MKTRSTPALFSPVTVKWVIAILERFSLDCRKTKTKVNTLANQRA